MKKAIMMLFLFAGITLQAQEFDFGCAPLTATVIIDVTIGPIPTSTTIEINSNQNIYEYIVPITSSAYAANGAFSTAAEYNQYEQIGGSLVLVNPDWEEKSTVFAKFQGDDCGDYFNVTVTITEDYDYSKNVTVEKYIGNIIKLACGG